MKFQSFIVVVLVLAIGACKTPYKATDRPVNLTDTTASARDTTADINQVPTSTDSTNLLQTDTSSAIIDSTNQSLPDSAKISSSADSVINKTMTDSTMNKMQPDSSRIATTADSTQMQGASGSAASVRAPDAVETAFTKQYPDATNAVWSNYDSLAAVPIDMRLTGWKKLDAEDYMVTFEFKNENYYSWYDNDGKWVGSAYTMQDYGKLPAAVNAAVQNAIKARYSDYNISQVNRELRTGNKSAYEVELTNDDKKVRMLVNADGKITQIFKYSADKSK
jgi:hypothetical protein